MMRAVAGYGEEEARDVKPIIDAMKFGSIPVDGETFDHDIVIRLSG
jgi:hypothetical protein